MRHGACVSFQQKAAGCQDVSRLAVEQSDRANVLRQSFLAEREHVFGCADAFEEGGGCFVDAAVGRLRGENHCDEQRVGIVPSQLALGMGVGCLQARVKAIDRGGGHKRGVQKCKGGRFFVANLLVAVSGFGVHFSFDEGCA